MSCSSKNEQKSCNLQTLTKARVFKQFQSVYVVLQGKDWSTKLLSRIFKILVQKKRFFFSKTNFFLKFLFFSSLKNQNTGIYVLDHYIVYEHTKFHYHFYVALQIKDRSTKLPSWIFKILVFQKKYQKVFKKMSFIFAFKLKKK